MVQREGCSIRSKQGVVVLITVALCTWNNCALLRSTLERLELNTQFSQADWELVVVNNCSTDDTDLVLKQFRERLPLRTVYEPEPGLSNARNRAVAEGRGCYYLWLDDDVLVGEDWLDAYRDAFIQYPDSAVFGGPVSPVFEGDPPTWLIDGFQSVRGAYACVDHGPEPRELSVSESILVVGANYAVRRKEQLANPYDPSLGVRGPIRMGGEEMTVIERILAENTGRWLPDARVQHFVPKIRQSLSWLEDRTTGGGTTLFVWHKQTNQVACGWRRISVLARLTLGVVRRWVRLWARDLTPVDYLSRLQSYWRARGYLKAYALDLLGRPAS